MSIEQGMNAGNGLALATERLRQFRREWRRSVLVHAFVRAIAALALLALVLLLLDRALVIPAGFRLALRWLPLVGFAGFLVPAMLRTIPGPDLARIALLAEERAGRGGGDDVDQLLTTALDLGGRGQGSSDDDPVVRAFARRVEERLRSLEWRGLLPGPSGRALAIALSALGAVLLFAFLEPGGASALWAHWAEAPRHASPTGSGPVPGDRADREGEAEEAGTVPALGVLRMTITPPAYTGLPAREASEADVLAALPGSRIRLHGGDPGGEADIVPRVITAGESGGAVLTPSAAEGGWTADWTLADGQRGISVELVGSEDGSTENALLERKVIPVTILEDRPPEVELLEPGGDLVLASPEGTVSIRARARDDYGIAALRLSWIHSSGSGESFSFDEGEWDWDGVRRSGDDVLGDFELDLSALDLRPGDVLHIRAMAQDGNDVTGPGEGVSPTRLLRIARDDEMGDVTTIIGFPIERDRDPLLSQRMIILLTEELLEEAPNLDRETFVERANEIAQEQTRLKGRVEEQIFMREAGAMEDPEEHLDHHDDEPPVEEPPRRGEDPEVGYRAMGDLEIQDHMHDSNPVLGIDDNLLAAYNAMWEAERHLMIGEADPSLPFQYRAMDHLQTLREEDRVYARGRTTTAPVDVSAARGEGDVDDAEPASRRAGPALPSTEAWLAEVEELMAIVPGLGAREAAGQASALAFRMLADAGGSAEAARHLSDAAERFRGSGSDAASEAERATAREEGMQLLGRAAEVLVPAIRGGDAAPVMTPSSPAGARYLRILRNGGGGS